MDLVCNQSLLLLSQLYHQTKPLNKTFSSAFHAHNISTSHQRSKLTTILTTSATSNVINMNTAETAAPSTAITITDNTPSDTRGKAPVTPPAPAPRARFFSIFRETKDGRGWKRGIALFDFILRLCAIGATLSATIAMATSDETLPFVTQRYQFYANYSDLPALSFFVIGNAIAAGYLIISLPLSIFAIIRPRAVGPRLLLLTLDLVMVGLTTGAAAAAAAIVYLAHTGDEKANWVAICLRFDGFCQDISGAVVASFVAVVILMLMIVMSALALRKH